MGSFILILIVILVTILSKIVKKRENKERVKVVKMGSLQIKHLVYMKNKKKKWKHNIFIIKNKE